MGKQIIVVTAACIAMFVSMTYILGMKYLMKKNVIDDELWDIQNTTLSDYSVEIFLNQNHWMNWTVR